MKQAIVDVYPLLFDPIYQTRIWGGRRLETLLGRSLPPAEPIGESWELSDLPGAESRVRHGPARGRSLHVLVEDWGTSLTGRTPLCDGRFPLLIKYLDADQPLSIQVHPPPDADADVSGPVKHEAWVVLHADPGGCVYRGLRPGVTADQLRSAIHDGHAPDLLERIPVRAGQALYLPAGVVHALGAGVLVAEVQTPSDVTYRLFDWNRADPHTGRPRDLHIEQALRCLRPAQNLVQAEARSHVASVWTSVTRLISCSHFVIERVRMIEGVEQDVPYAEPVIWMILAGEGEVSCKFGDDRMIVGFAPSDTVLLPAGLREARVRTSSVCTWLEITIPVPSPLAGFDRPDRAALRAAAEPPPAFVPLAVRPEKREK